MDAVELIVPAVIGDYTDFYASAFHATNVGRLFRPDNPLMPNYKWIPIGYHGRSSSVVVSGHDFKRPVGQVKPQGADAPVVRASQRMDIELELGVFVGAGNALGEPIAMAQAEDHVFGFVLLNDWSARDIQPWEYQPLGPFLAKNFATTISPWIVTTEALAPYRAAPPERPAGDPAPLAYLDSPENGTHGAIDMQLEVLLQTPKMKEANQRAARICLTNYQYAYWTFAQLVAHHTVNGCNLRPGDLFGTGTLSGPNPDQAAALIEITQGGRQPITLPNGETHTFLEDGDSVILRGWCEKAGHPRIGLGECRGTVLPAHRR
jgi:fumarylacetoacetase